ncbi:MAG: DUF4153 domain-containing protein [Brevundimonas sp.]|nr:DUF4153 domain-containing protein [Brevundimonas sp.]MBP8072384.1 DUF4153 domain-containing protein [Brevundimonas sp.]
MTDTTEATGRDSLGGTASPLLGPIRLGIGLAQGLGLFWLDRSADSLLTNTLCSNPAGCGPGLSWPATEPLVFGPLLLIVAFLPMVLLAGVGRLRPVTLAIWTVVAGVALALLGLHDIARQSADTLRYSPFLSAPVILFSAAALFIAHHLVAAADLEHRRVPAFAALFDTASKAAVQLALSVGFTGAFWVLLTLGSALFKVIGLDFLEDLLRKEWFAIPITFVVFATAVHLTDVRDGLIRGVRTVGLMLLSWLLLVMTLLAAGFVAALPFTGLDGLWETGSATSLVLTAAAALIILINAAYQDGRADNRPPAVLRVAVRVAAVLITPLVVIAVWGLALRIGQYGLTPDRIIAGACALVGAAFATGYGWAALSPFWRKGDWMRPLEPTTIWTAVLAVAVILLLFSPVLDPARLSVMDQVARLERGAVAPDRFDYRFLRFESGKSGQAALERLTRSSNADIATRARAVQTDDRSYRPTVVPVRPVPTAADIRIRVYPSGATLPASFTGQYGRLVEVLGHCTDEQVCAARLIDLDRDGAEDVLIARQTTIAIFKRAPGGLWYEWAMYHRNTCADRAKDIPQAFADGRFETAPPVFPDLIVDGVRMRHEEGEPECPGVPEPTVPAMPTEVGGR